MYGSELRACALGAVVSVLLGAGIGFGWHYFANNGSGRAAVASAATPPAKQDAPNPVSSNPPPQPESSVPDVTRSPDLSRAARGAAPDLSEDQKLALVALLTRTIQGDRYPSSPRVRILRDILVKLNANLPGQPYSNAQPEETRTGARRKG